MPGRAGDTGDDAERVMTALRRLVRAIRSSTAAVQRAAGVSGPQLFVLRALIDQPGQSMRELVARTLTTQSSVSAVVARLVSAGLVARGTAPDDGRRAVLRPTAAGRALVRAAPPSVQADLIAGLEALRPGTRRALANGLEEWLAAAGLGDVPATMFFEPPRDRHARA